MSEVPVIPRFKEKDDALHFYTNDKYYEWWYLDAQFDNGYSCVVIFHYRFVFTTPRIPCIQLNIYSPDGSVVPALKSFSEKDVSASTEYCSLEFGGNFLKYENGVYKLSVRSKRAGAELTFKNILPGWRPESQGMVHNDGDVQDWVVPVPRGEVEGTLFIGDSAIKVKGNHGYHDHNWGNSNMWDYFSHWYWGRLYHEKYTLIYSWVYPVRKDYPMYTMFYLAGMDRPLVITRNFKLEEARVEMDPDLKRQYARELIVTCRDRGIEFDGCISTKHVVEKLDQSSFAKRPVYYCRFLADYNAEIRSNGKAEKLSGQTLYEFMDYRQDAC